MSTFAEDGLPIRLPRLLSVNARPKLQRLAADLAKRYGPPRDRAGQPSAILASAAQKLAETGGDLEALTQRERKAAIELFWSGMHGWVPGLADRRRWLAWVSSEWGSRIGVTRVAMSFVRNFDPSSEATREVCSWLVSRTHELSGRFGKFVQTHVLPEGSAAAENVARSLASGDQSFFQDADSDIRCGAVTRGSGFLVAVVSAFGRLCSERQLREAETVTNTLLGFLGEHGLSGARGSQAMRDEARIAMVTGIVDWASQSFAVASIDIALQIVLSLADDPRISLSRWRDIPEDTRDTVEAWLTARTLENLFRVIDELKTDRPDMWQERQAFWRGYLPHIKRAYLLCAPMARPIAERLKERHGLLRSTEQRHCGILMQIVGPQGDKLTVLEVNKNASALFWSPGSSNAPEFNGSEYHRKLMLDDCDHRKYHMGSWQEAFAQLIESETGIRRTTKGEWRG